MKPILAAIAALPLAGFAAPAAAGGACGEPAVLETIARDFARHAPVYQGIDATIDAIDGIRLTRAEPRTADISSVERHYCHADIALSDGGRHDLWYLVEHGMGFAGYGLHVEFCVAGLDPWHVYGAACRSLR
ncbi:hypothetical protein [Shinella pollutisoli]|uniref:Cytoplasmic protein n=1 Tax=Shinella pollutisoli TaxID=2250594 RepID=A0ABV7DBP9_9HYPH|nr:hypothetical protein [Shinella pollutisoli]